MFIGASDENVNPQPQSVPKPASYGSVPLPFGKKMPAKKYYADSDTESSYDSEEEYYTKSKSKYAGKKKVAASRLMARRLS